MSQWINQAALQIVRFLPSTFDPLIPPDLDDRPKVFGIGFHKTGTTSLGRALRILGFRVQKGFTINRPGKPTVSEPVTVDKVWQIARRLVPRYGAFEDNPWPLLFRQIDAAFPGSKFILTSRQPDRWLRSAARYFATRRIRQPLLYGCQFAIAGNETAALERYQQHNHEVLDHFSERRQDLLELDFETSPGWDPLCRFLDCPTPRAPFPHANRAGTKR